MKPKSVFYKAYFTVIALFSVALIIGLLVFRGWLADYEAAQPEPIVNKLIESHIKTGDLYSVKDKYNLKISDYETKSNFDSFLKSLTDGKELTGTTSAVKPEGCDAAYQIKADGEKILNVYLKKDGKTKRYFVSGCEFDSSVYKTLKITAASDAEIKINGVAVKAEDRKDEPLPDIKSDLLKSDKLIKKQIISITDLLNEPESVTATSGKKALTVENDSGVYSVAEDFPEKSAVGDFAGKAASTYAEYMQNDSNLTNIKKYIDDTTELYKNIKSSLVIFSLDHEGHTIKDIKTTDFHKYNDSLFSCRVRLTNALKRNGAIYEDKFDKYVYLKKDGDTYKAIDMQNTGDSVK